ncbi:hypothetical protein DQ04_03371070 [Trypanosoma grayi]|uniref:hypothetical protein n=1 Tax=Trypanosoma grayi TaxID=71804 RepID=UPI0004F47C61|nr:hypothetical protein DQ04_03371070 [Trypanosoma grayi]KEG10727.1 hypothetical protein DQ04_03371070 [Trypanosoma grayi]
MYDLGTITSSQPEEGTSSCNTGNTRQQFPSNAHDIFGTTTTLNGLASNDNAGPFQETQRPSDAGPTPSIGAIVVRTEEEENLGEQQQQKQQQKQQQQVVCDSAGYPQKRSSGVTNSTPDARSLMPFLAHSVKPETSPIAVNLGALTGTVMHDIIQAPLNFQGPPKLMVHPRPNLRQSSMSASLRQGSVPTSAVFSMSPSGCTPLSASLQTEGSFGSKPRSPTLKVTPWNGKITRSPGKAKNWTKRAPMVPSPQERQVSRSDCDGTPRASFLLPTKIPPLSTVGATGGFPCQLETPLQAPELLRQQPPRLSYSTTTTPTNKGGARNEHRTGAKNNAGGGTNTRVVNNCATSRKRSSLPTISIASGVSPKMQPTRGERGVERGNTLEVSPSSSQGTGARSGLDASGSLPHASPRAGDRASGIGGAGRVPCQVWLPQESKTHSVQELLVHEIVSRLRPL